MQIIAQPQLDSDRILIRPFFCSDAPGVQLLAGDRRVSRYTMNIPYPYEDGIAENWIASQKGAWASSQRAEFAVVEKTSERLVGTVGLVDISHNEAELGFWIGVPFWGNGYCTEAATLLLEYGAREMQIVKFTARHLTANPASGKVMEKLGMIHTQSRQGPDRNGTMALFEFYEMSIN